MKQVRIRHTNSRRPNRTQRPVSHISRLPPPVLLASPPVPTHWRSAAACFLMRLMLAETVRRFPAGPYLGPRAPHPPRALCWLQLTGPPPLSSGLILGAQPITPPPRRQEEWGGGGSSPSVSWSQPQPFPSQPFSVSLSHRPLRVSTSSRGGPSQSSQQPFWSPEVGPPPPSRVG